MNHIWTPNQTPEPCRCVKYNPVSVRSGVVKCGTCGRPYSKEFTAKIGGELPEFLTANYLPQLSPALTEALKPDDRPSINGGAALALLVRGRQAGRSFTRRNADAERNHGGHTLPEAHLHTKRIAVPIEAQDRVTPAQVEAVGKKMVARMRGEIERIQTLLMLGYRPAEKEPEPLATRHQCGWRSGRPE